MDFTIENRLNCLNTNFQKGEGNLWIYTYANNTKAQIDYVFIRVLLLIRGCLLRSPNCHVKNTTEPTKECHPNGDHRTLLNYRDIRDKYAITLRKKFDDRQEKTETHTPNDEY